MVVMTAKVSKAKLIAVVCILALVICGTLALLGGKEPKADAALDLDTNEGRIAFLNTYGWEVEEAPVETQDVRIPEEANEVFEKYNALQRSQGFDLSGFSGKQVKRYVYQITNHANAASPVYATLLIYKNAVIGGDITATDGDGMMHGFEPPKGSQLLPETSGAAPDAAEAPSAEAAPPDSASTGSAQTETPAPESGTGSSAAELPAA